jgi:hypothetical protein
MDKLHKERKLMPRYTSIRLYGERISEGLVKIDNEVMKILIENPDLDKNDITISTEAYQEEWEDYSYGVIELEWESYETDDEYNLRLQKEREKEEKERKIYEELKKRFENE